MRVSLATLLCSITVFLLIRVSDLSSIDEAEPFRMGKVNLVWMKAKKLALSKAKLNELFVELQRQDKDERKLKHKKAEGHDKDGEMEAVIRRNLMRIMEKYGLDGVRNEHDQSSPNSSDRLLDIDSNKVKKFPRIKDERLDKLWREAVDGDRFDKHELEELRKELDHHHDKWQQYHSLVSLVFEHEEKDGNVAAEMTETEKERFNKLREEMDVKQQEVNSNYRRLKVKIARGADEEDFQDHRVRELWKHAKARISSDEELSIMKEELKHFDHKIAKHDHLQEQLDVAEDLLSQGHDHIKSKHEKLSSKVKEHRRYIKKMHVTLTDKIGPHNEL